MDVMFARSVKLVTFDVTHTLLQFKGSPGQLYAKTAAEHDVKINTDDAMKKFKSNFKQMSCSHPNFGKGSIGWEEWWRIIVRKTFEDNTHDKGTIEKIATDLIDLYKTDNAWDLSKGTESILQFLKETNVILGVISNSDPRLNDILINKGIHHYFKFILNSYDADYMKPDPNIFNLALRQSEIKDIVNEECWHVGDDYINDLKGALDCGWQASIITNKKHDTIQSERTFSSLIDLHKYFMNKNIFL